MVREKIKGGAEEPPNASEQAEYSSNSAGRPWVFGGLAQWVQDAGSWERSSESCLCASWEESSAVLNWGWGWGWKAGPVSGLSCEHLGFCRHGKHGNKMPREEMPHGH